MYICPNCGRTYNTPVNFCDSCGSQVTQHYTAVQPVYQPAPVYRAPSSPKNIGGLVLGIVGMVCGIVSAIYTIFGLLTSSGVPSRVADEMLTMFGVFGLIFAIIGLPLSIVGMTISSGHINRGSTHKTASLGKVFGSVGLIISAAHFLFSLIMIISAA